MPPMAKAPERPAARLGSLIALALLLLAGLAAAAPRDANWQQRWAAHDPASVEQIDHGAWQAFLARYVRIAPDGVHRVAYGQVTEADRERLERYIATLAGERLERYARDEQLAYWINLYNALVVREVLDHYPLGSVRDLDEGAGPWHRELVEIDGVPLSLHDIDRYILRPIWDDLRILYALSCGAVGCPDLRAEPYRGAVIDRQLTRAAMTYINDPRCILIEADRLVVSSLFRWHRGEFEDDDRRVISHLLAFAEPRLAMKLQQFDRISGEMFDWRLNDATLL
jgi:hypothetical protein